MNVPFLITLACAMLAPLPLAQARAQATTQTSEFPSRSHLLDCSLLTLSGNTVRFGDIAGEGILVVAYTGVGCPISGKYAPRLQALADEYRERGVRFITVEAGPLSSVEELAKEVKELDVTFPAFKDHRQELTRQLKATTTTEVFLFDAEGELRYRGGVDDQYALGAAKPKANNHWLSAAIDAVLAGGKVEHKQSAAPGCLLTLLPASEFPEKVTWSKDIARIFQANCMTCHRPDQIGPFSLQTYKQAKNWGAMIASVVEEQRMPPWNADERFNGHFANQRSLNIGERTKIIQWVSEGMQRGNPIDDPAPIDWPEGWRIGEPDAVFAFESEFYGGAKLPEKGYEVAREGTLAYQVFVVETAFPEDRWIQAMEIQPGAKDVVHHAVVTVHDPSTGPFNARSFVNFLAAAAPGDTPSVYPEGYAKKLPAGASLVFQMHYTPNGKQRFDRTRLAMIFSKEPPIFEVLTTAIINFNFEIPPGAPNHEVRAEVKLEDDLGLMALYPHMHTRGKDFLFVAHFPDGTDEELLFSHFDFNWQESYTYRDPKLLPSGTRIEIIGHFDNTADNPNNPAPDQSVRWGEQTWEEMLVGTYDYVIPIDD